MLGIWLVHLYYSGAASGEIAGTSTFVLMSSIRTHLLGLYNIWVDLFASYVTLGYIKLLISFAYDLTFFNLYA